LVQLIDDLLELFDTDPHFNSFSFRWADNYSR